MLDLRSPVPDGDRLACLLPLLDVADRPRTRRGGDGRTRLAPAIGAILIHAVLLTIMVRLVVSPLPPPRDEPGFVVMVAPLSTVSAATLQVLPLPTAPLAPVRALSFKTEPAREARLPAAGKPPVAGLVKPRGEVAGDAAPSPGIQSGPVAAPAIELDALLPALERRIDAAVQQAAILPPAARRQHREGRARLRFTYLDGAVRDVRVVASSLSRLLDDAARAAVQDAPMPSAPAPLRGRRLNMLVWISFRLVPDAG